MGITTSLVESSWLQRKRKSFAHTVGKGLLVTLQWKSHLNVLFAFWLSFHSSKSQAINYVVKDSFHWNWRKVNFSRDWTRRNSWTLRMASTITKGSWAMRSTALFESFCNSSELTADFPQFVLNILSVRFFIGLWWTWVHKIQTSKTLDFRWQGDIKAIVCALLWCLQQIRKESTNEKLICGDSLTETLKR